MLIVIFRKFNGYFLSLGPEYGTMEAAWKGGMVEAERLSDLHLSVRDRLVNDVIAQIKNWQKDTYHKVSEMKSNYQYNHLYEVKTKLVLI